VTRSVTSACLARRAGGEQRAGHAAGGRVAQRVAQARQAAAAQCHPAPHGVYRGGRAVAAARRAAAKRGAPASRIHALVHVPRAATRQTLDVHSEPGGRVYGQRVDAARAFGASKRAFEGLRAGRPPACHSLCWCPKGAGPHALGHARCMGFSRCAAARAQRCWTPSARAGRWCWRAGSCRAPWAAAAWAASPGAARRAACRRRWSPTRPRAARVAPRGLGLRIGRRLGRASRPPGSRAAASGAGARRRAPGSGAGVRRARRGRCGR